MSPPPSIVAGHISSKRPLGATWDYSSLGDNMPFFQTEGCDTAKTEAKEEPCPLTHSSKISKLQKRLVIQSHSSIMSAWIDWAVPVCVSFSVLCLTLWRLAVQLGDGAGDRYKWQLERESWFDSRQGQAVLRETLSHDKAGRVDQWIQSPHWETLLWKINEENSCDWMYSFLKLLIRVLNLDLLWMCCRGLSYRQHRQRLFFRVWCW